jgi:putative acetyltransferase
MFNVLYRWRLKPGAEESFGNAWADMTVLLRKSRGALGSRLHKAEDGTWVAYARWPDKACWEKSSREGSVDEKLSSAMQDAIDERFDPMLLHPVKDLLGDPAAGAEDTGADAADGDITIRVERPDDADEVYKVNQRAFGRDAEAKLVDMLRKADVSHISLVAIADETLAAHIIFSPVAVERADRGLSAMGLAPMAVLPDYQKHGVGSRLARAGIDACREADVDVVFVLGHIDFYSRFGFEPAAKFGLFYGTEEFGPYFMALELTPGSLEGLSGLVQYRQEFDDV